MRSKHEVARRTGAVFRKLLPVSLYRFPCRSFDSDAPVGAYLPSVAQILSNFYGKSIMDFTKGIQI